MDGWRGTSGIRKVKTDMMRGSERLSRGQSLVNWQWYCSSRLNVTTLTKLIHTVTQTDSRPSVSPAVDCGGRCLISWPLLSVTTHPCLAPGARHGPDAHECMCVIDGDPRFNRAREKMRQSEETDTYAVGDVFYQSWPAILAGLIPYYTALLRLPLLAVCFRHILYILCSYTILS